MSRAGASSGRLKIIVLVALVAGALGGIALLLVTSHEPRYEGQPAGYWVMQLNGTNATQRLMALAALTQTNKEAVPFLMRAAILGDTPRDRFLKWMTTEVAPKLPAGLSAQIPVPISPASFHRATALHSLSRMGPDAAPAMPLAIRLVESEDYQIAPAAANMLGALGNTARPAVPALVRSLGHTNNKSSRIAVAGALAKIGETNAKVSAALRAAMQDPSAEVRLAVIDAYWELTKDGHTVAAPIAVLVNDADDGRVWRAAELFQKVGPEPDLVLPTLVAALQHENPRIRGKAAIVLGCFGARAEPVLAALEERLEDRHANVREAAAEAIQQIRAPRD